MDDDCDGLAPDDDDDDMFEDDENIPMNRGETRRTFQGKARERIAQIRKTVRSL